MTSVVIVDDHQLFRSGVRAELDGFVDVLGDAATVEDAVRLVVEAEPDVVVLDVQMPGGGGVEVIRQVAERLPAPGFLSLSVG
jgi:DNA-binding NarL/FixJ family response regulator